MTEEETVEEVVQAVSKQNNGTKDRIITGLIAIIFGMGSGSIGSWSISEPKSEATQLEYRVHQLELFLYERRPMVDNLVKVTEAQQSIINQLNQQINSLNQQISLLNQRLNSVEKLLDREFKSNLSENLPVLKKETEDILEKKGG